MPLPKGFRFSKEAREKRKKSPRVLEHMRNLAEKRRGKKLSKTHRKKISKSLIGIKRSKKTKQKISQGLKGLHSGNKHPNWQGGRYKESNGYFYIHIPNHPFCNSHGYYPEHRLILEKKLGRYLKPNEVAHHINGIIDDNRPKNLECLPNISEHFRLHKRYKQLSRDSSLKYG